MDVKDYDTDKIERITNNFVSEFAAINTKLSKKIGTGDENYLNISVEGTYGLQRFPEYLSKFTDGDLSVDESIEQLLSGGFGVSYTEGLPGNFTIKPYFGVNFNRSLSDEIKITARNENSNVSSSEENWSGYHAGVSFAKNVKNINFNLDLMYGNEDGLINEIAAFSVTKSLGKTKEIKYETKTDENMKLANVKTDESLLEFGQLKKIKDQLKNENIILSEENKKLKSLFAKIIQENEDSKKLIVELLKENEKIKLEKEIFKNRLLENENERLKQQIESTIPNKGINKFTVLLLVVAFLLLAYGISTLIFSIFHFSFKK